ncbi:MAG: hypothetical protein ACRC4W_05050 [Treponemataceae bacterium]
MMKLILQKHDNKQSLYGKRGRGTADKIPIFGLLKRGGKLYIYITNNTTTNILLSAINENGYSRQYSV